MAERAILDWSDEGAPRSRRFDDIYFSAEGGLEESRAVFLAGCGLPEAWQGRSRFTVGELGFGAGLNILALLDLWRRTRPEDGRLHIFSIEAFPLSRRDAARALAAWPALADLATPLIHRWPEAEGFHRIDIPDLGASLDLAVMEAAEALEAWSGRADAWFLDGFSPARNPQMWRQEVLDLVAARSAPGARAATFTVAGAVRRGLQGAGFVVERRPGFGRKAERLEATFGSGAPAANPAPPRVAIVGAGIAGAALARAFAAEGCEPLVISGGAIAASGNPAALVTPRFDAGGGLMARLHAQAFARAVALYEVVPGAVIARGALQLEAAERDRRRFDTVAASPLFEPGALERLDPSGAGDRLGELRETGGLWIAEGLTVEPRPILDAWIGPARRLQAEARALSRSAEGWAVLGPDGEMLVEADIVCLAGGYGSKGLWPQLALEPVRGQASFLDWSERPQAAAWGGYLIPTRTGLLFGATHDRGREDVEILPEDHTRTLRTLAEARPALAEALAGQPLEGRAALRASTPDRAPIAGALEPGLIVLTGLGGRGFTLAPLLAEHLAAEALGAPSPLPRQIAVAVGHRAFKSAARTRAIN